MLIVGRGFSNVAQLHLTQRGTDDRRLSFISSDRMRTSIQNILPGISTRICADISRENRSEACEDHFQETISNLSIVFAGHSSQRKIVACTLERATENLAEEIARNDT
jgi:hypothetical protein